MIAEEAYKQLIEIQGRDLLSKSLDVRLRDWLELMEEVCGVVWSWFGGGGGGGGGDDW